MAAHGLASATGRCSSRRRGESSSLRALMPSLSDWPPAARAHGSPTLGQQRSPRPRRLAHARLAAHHQGPTLPPRTASISPSRTPHSLRRPTGSPACVPVRERVGIPLATDHTPGRRQGLAAMRTSVATTYLIAASTMAMSCSVVPPLTPTPAITWSSLVSGTPPPIAEYLPPETARRG